MTYKEDLQAEAERLGLEFTTRTTIAELEELIDEAESQPAEQPDPNKRCPVCNKVYNHIHR